MDVQQLATVLSSTFDPNLREEAEKKLNEVGLACFCVAQWYSASIFRFCEWFLVVIITKAQWYCAERLKARGSFGNWTALPLVFGICLPCLKYVCDQWMVFGIGLHCFKSESLPALSWKVVCFENPKERSFSWTFRHLFIMTKLVWSLIYYLISFYIANSVISMIDFWLDFHNFKMIEFLWF